MKRILIVNVNWIGDVILSSPIFRTLKNRDPDAHVACMAVPRVREILESISGIDEIIIFDEDGAHKSFPGKLKLIFELKKRKFDIAFLLHKSLTRALLVFLAGIPKRVGYDTKKRGMFLTHKVSPLQGYHHRSDEYLNVIESYGITVSDRRTILEVGKKSAGEVDDILTSRGVSPKESLLVIHCAANWTLKRWPKEHCIRFINKTMTEQPWKVILTGSGQDEALIKEIVRSLISPPVNLTGVISLKQFVALIKRATLMISPDSGPLHIASSVGTKCIALFGPTSVEITSPRGVNKTIILRKDVGCNREACYHLQCPDNICMQAITVEDVLDAIRQI